MSQILFVMVFLAGLCAVLSYPLDVDDQLYDTPPGFYEIDRPSTYYQSDLPDSYIYGSPYQEAFLSKRSRSGQKRSSLNQLLRRLIALYGSNDIPFSGQSAHMRFGAGGR